MYYFLLLHKLSHGHHHQVPELIPSRGGSGMWYDNWLFHTSYWVCHNTLASKVRPYGRKNQAKRLAQGLHHQAHSPKHQPPPHSKHSLDSLPSPKSLALVAQHRSWVVAVVLKEPGPGALRLGLWYSALGCRKRPPSLPDSPWHPRPLSCCHLSSWHIDNISGIQPFINTIQR